jgi:hypothetical protein
MPALRLHHDHSAQHGRRRAELSYWAGRPQRPARFAPARICPACNAVDDAVRRKLNLPRDFSFSVEEINFLVRPTPQGHQINYRAAAALIRHLTYRGVVAPAQG